jgi:hypothetical protein
MLPREHSFVDLFAGIEGEAKSEEKSVYLRIEKLTYYFAVNGEKTKR